MRKWAEVMAARSTGGGSIAHKSAWFDSDGKLEQRRCDCMDTAHSRSSLAIYMARSFVWSLALASTNFLGGGDSG